MQGFNMGRYVPPDAEGVLNPNQASGKGHALGARARKAGQGILTVRFEMPFPIWCQTCPKPTIIGQGVRFNAEKKKVGSYYSTSIYSFRMKHNVCGGPIEIRTDPQTTTYIVTEGASKRDMGEDILRDGEMVIAGGQTEEEKRRLENDPFAALEGKVGDKHIADSEKSRIKAIYASTERDWENPDTANVRMRRKFRSERKLREEAQRADKIIKARLGIDVDLVEPNEADVIKSSMVEFGTTESPTYQPLWTSKNREKEMEKKLHQERTARRGSRKKLRSGSTQKADILQRTLIDNTRSNIDPFTSSPGKIVGYGADIGLKFRTASQSSNSTRRTEVPQSRAIDGALVPLIAYDSD